MVVSYCRCSAESGLRILSGKHGPCVDVQTRHGAEEIQLMCWFTRPEYNHQVKSLKRRVRPYLSWDTAQRSNFLCVYMLTSCSEQIDFDIQMAKRAQDRPLFIWFGIARKSAADLPFVRPDLRVRKSLFCRMDVAYLLWSVVDTKLNSSYRTLYVEIASGHNDSELQRGILIMPWLGKKRGLVNPMDVDTLLSVDCGNPGEMVNKSYTWPPY